MDAYIYAAALWCPDCIREVKLAKAKPAHADEADESTYDSDEWPKGPYPNGGGEADCPQHCDACGVFLENPLTGGGESYVREHVEEDSILVGARCPYPMVMGGDGPVVDLPARSSAVVAEWRKHYGYL